MPVARQNVLGAKRTVLSWYIIQPLKVKAYWIKFSTNLKLELNFEPVSIPNDFNIY